MIGLENIVFPSSFSEEMFAADKRFTYTGVAARRDIGHREAILAIPFECLISPRTFREEEPELFEYVTQECPDLFDEKVCQDSEQLLITFFLMHEWTKGKASKWYAYINSLP